MRLKTESEMRQIREDSVKENSVENFFTYMARKYRCKHRKNMGGLYGAEGWPDRVLVWPDGRGTADWVELKRPKGGKFEPKQPQVQAELRACGARVETLYTRDEVRAYFARRARELGVGLPKAGSKRGLAKLHALQRLSV